MMIATMKKYGALNENFKIKDKENISKRPKVIGAIEKRPVLQDTNVLRQDIKNLKLTKNVIVPPSKDVPKNKKGGKVKSKIDSNLLKIVPSKKVPKRNESTGSLDRKMSTDFSQDILNYHKETECFRLPKPNYMENLSLTWNMRSIVVDWLVCVSSEYNLSQEALYLAVNYIDRFLSKTTVISEKLQLVGASAMLIAGKMEEIYPPMSKEWSYLTCDTYTPQEIRKMEQIIVKALDFRLQPPTSYTFLKKLCNDHNIDKSTTNLAEFLSELVLLEGKDYLNYKPSELAASSILLARLYRTTKNVWPEEIEKSSGYTVKDLSPIVESQNLTLKNSPHGKGQSIKEKYSSPKYGRVALIKPRRIMYDNSSEEMDGGIFLE